jgi:beta-galactosidase
MIFLLALVAMLAGAEPASAQPGQEHPRQRLLMDFGWSFAKGDQPGGIRDFGRSSNRVNWREVNLPHDWSIEGRFTQDNPSGGSGGFAPLGIGWYRRIFHMPPEWNGKRTVLEFEGIFNAAEVYANNQLICRNSYGYIGFACDLTAWARPGQDNTILVRVDNSRQASRWYTGSGIFRHVWLTVTDAVHVAHWGTYITTPEATADRARVNVATILRNDSDEAKAGKLRTRLLSPDGRAAGTSEALFRVPAHSETKITQVLYVSKPLLWAPATPRLYRSVSEVREGPHLIDDYETAFGIRTIKWDPKNALTINGERTVIRGVNLHDDLGALGTAAFDSAIEHRLETLKEIGVNGIRTSHNPHAPALLDLCDRMGFVVFDEAFDKWSGFHTDGTGWDHDLSSFIKRDRNHPSVIIWSVGNEVQYQKMHEGALLYQAMSKAIQRLDSTRRVTVSLERTRTVADKRNEWAPLPEMANYMEVVSLNYQTVFYAHDHEKYPNKVLLGGEVEEVRTDLEPKDDRTAWFATRDYVTNKYFDYVAGQFIWAGVDYLGESARWPRKGFGNNLVNTAGFRTSFAPYMQSLYSDHPTVAIAVEDPRHDSVPLGYFQGWHVQGAHWNWADAPKPLKVFTYTNAPVVELLLNGKSLGEKRLADFANRIMYWEVPFTPGTLRALAKNDGKVVATCELKTAGKPAAVELKPSRGQLHASGQDLSYVEVRLVDADGVVVPNVPAVVHFEVSGPATIAGVDNGDLDSLETYKGNQRETRDGRCLVIVQSKRESGTIHLRARVDGLPESSVDIDVRPGGGPPILE